MNKQGVIYKIENLVNGMVYIGQTITSYERRIGRHKWELRNHRHNNTHLQRAWDKYGENNFKFSIIEYCDIEVIDDREKYWIKEYKATDEQYGYNLESGGNKGKRVSDGVKQKISKAVIKAMQSPTYRLVIHRGADNGNAKKVICINDGLIYNTLTEAGKYYGIRMQQISKVVSGERVSCYSKKFKKYLQFAYYEDGKQYQLKEDVNIKTPKPVICITTGEIFKSSYEAAKHYNLSQGSLIRCLHNEGRYLGKDREGNKLMWAYLENYDPRKEYKVLKYEGARNHNSRPVICITTNEYFESQMQAARKYNISQSKISLVCSGKRKHAGELPDGTKLEWKYA